MAQSDEDFEYGGPEGAAGIEGEAHSRGDDAGDPLPPMQIPLEGFADVINAKVGGGVKPESSEVTLASGRVPVSGQFDIGDEVLLLLRCRVWNVSFPTTKDNYGNLGATKRVQHLTPIGVQRADQPDVLVQRLLDQGLTPEDISGAAARLSQR